MIRNPSPLLSSNGLSYLSDTDKAGCINYIFTFISTSLFNLSISILLQLLLFPATVRFSTLKIMLCLSFLTFLVLMAFPHECLNSSLIPLFILFATYPVSQYLEVLFYLNGKPVLFFLSPSPLLDLLPLLTIYLYLSSLLPVKFMKNTSFLSS